MGGLTNGRTDERTDKRMNESPLCSTGLRPLRGRCPASFQFTTMQSRATGIADHVLPLGDLFLLFFLVVHVVPSTRLSFDQPINCNYGLMQSMAIMSEQNKFHLFAALFYFSILEFFLLLFFSSLKRHSFSHSHSCV